MKKILCLFLLIALTGCSTVEAKEKKNQKSEFYENRFQIIYEDRFYDDEINILLDKETGARYLIYKYQLAFGQGLGVGVGITPLIEKEK